MSRKIYALVRHFSKKILLTMDLAVLSSCAGADINAITCQEAVTKTLAPVHKRKWQREESKYLSSENNNKSPRLGGGKYCEKNRVQTFLGFCFFQSWKKQSPRNVGTLFFSQHFPPISGTLFFFRAEMFGLLSPSLPLMYWSQGSVIASWHAMAFLSAPEQKF